MSLFPGKLRPGGTVTVHLRVNAKSPVWVQQKAFIEDPDGKRSACLDLVHPCLPADFDREEVRRIKAGAGPFQANPLLTAAHYLSNDKFNADHFIKALIALREATHFYTTYRLPDDAPLGKYRVRLEIYHDGDMVESATADTDFFLVEDLKLRSLSGGEASVDNPSPETVLSRLYDPLNSERLIALPPRSTTKILVKSPAAFLLYAGGVEMLKLGAPGDPFCLRNQTLRALPKADGTTFVFVTRSADPKGHQLDALGSEIWRLADGMATRGMIRSHRTAATYDEMLAHGLILELD